MSQSSTNSLDDLLELRETTPSFWQWVEPDANCWHWTGNRLPSGYGRVSVRGTGLGKKNLYAHRVAYELVLGPIRDGLHVLHRCDNPPCVRPDHLFLGTQADNVADRDRKGRQASRATAPNGKWRRGEESPCARLTSQDVLSIRKWHELGMSSAAISRRLGVAPTTVGHVVRGHTWRHVP